MSKNDFIKVPGIVREVLPKGKYSVEMCDDSGRATGHMVRAVPCGKIIMNSIRILRGDKVTLELSPYDLNNGRICWVTK